MTMTLLWALIGLKQELTQINETLNYDVIITYPSFSLLSPRFQTPLSGPFPYG
jgi:hypothetical protein